MTRYFILDDNDAPQYVGMGDEGRNTYEAWQLDSDLFARRERGRQMIDAFTMITLEFDGIVTSGQPVSSIQFWTVRRRTVRSPDSPRSSVSTIERRIGLGSARLAFRMVVEREQRTAEVRRMAGIRAEEARILSALRSTMRASASRATTQEPQQVAVEFTTDLIGTPIHPQGAVPVFDDEHEPDEDI